MKISDEVKKDLDRFQTAELNLHVEGEMVFHPLLQSLPTGGFYVDPEETAEVLKNYCPDAPSKYLKFGFATTPESCQGLELTDLIESASQDMYEDWYETVTDTCREEIKIAQAAVNALHRRLMDFPTWRVDWTRIVKLPILVGIPEKSQKGVRKK